MTQIGFHAEAMLLAMMILLTMSLFPAFGLMFILMGVIVFPAFLLIRSIVNLAVIPVGLMELASDQRARVNHALEHATVNILEEKAGPQPGTIGYATADGFWLVTDLPDTLVARALSEAWKRLEAGESELAIHSRCGTTLAAGQLLFSALFMAAFLFSGGFSFTGLLIAAAAGSLLSPWTGAFLQKHLTTSADVSGIRPVGISQISQGGLLRFLPMRRRRSLFISTAPIDEVMARKCNQHWGVWTLG
ncbi:MAG: hypothetical protein CVV64_13870 [Candidatus Wallbacteria bacterium HGW-Wallbacteria-1]|jgi:hypothetical protein|uniref:Uncharacterized protein n=1 Tax=Candidatus Wallbacteria bacterium HGW-Wallbacteria-1 TaxID=2013854 RepID=A0A2N1PMD2_9BACT|nr:MAG: hypothetical protein CVV64_13870 [Candidatus Wallbacteria bacterium HGW-Wallbacteria-1]